MEPSADHDIDDAYFLKQISQRDEQALGALYDRFDGLIFSLLMRMIGDRDRAEELLQDVFLTVWRSASTWDPKRGTVRGWLVSIARHKAIDHLRTEKNAALPLVHDIPSIQPSPDEEVVNSTVAYAVRDSLKQLPSSQRDVLLAVYFSGLTQQEVADEFGIPLGTVKSRLRLALKRLARNLRLRGVLQ